MKAFMDCDFLLTSDVAKRLYHDYAEKTPVIDYHCHLDAREIAEDKKFKNITELWLGGDHYKWRIMRSNGIEEKYITGDASDEEKFMKFAECLPRAIGNPMYHWCHLELKKYFDYHGVLSPKTAKEVWELCNKKLQEPGMSARNLIKNSNVTLVCTTDDPVDSLEFHRQIAEDKTFDVQVLPAWRPDMAMSIEKPEFLAYIKKLSDVSGVKIDSFQNLCQALVNRLNHFAENGCVISDHGLDYADYLPVSGEETEKIFAKALKGENVTKEEEKAFKTMCMIFLGKEYSKRNWVMQLHYGAKRENHKKIYRMAGANAGIDCINEKGFSAEVADYLNELAETNELPKTIIYSLNPVDNAVIGTLIGCFQDEAARGKIQQGAAWWFNDHKTGMIDQMTSLSNLGILGNFIGMLTDSRSFVSYPRHEYFRRILCNLIGSLVENGEYPADMDMLGELVNDISYYNAVRYFGFDL